jgi:hypothetical protein
MEIKVSERKLRKAIDLWWQIDNENAWTPAKHSSAQTEKILIETFAAVFPESIARRSGDEWYAAGHRFRGDALEKIKKAETEPPRLAISFTNLEEINWFFSEAGKNIVSIFPFNREFMHAIWNSYSKSETALSPRTIMLAPILLAKFTSRPSNFITFTLLAIPYFSR